MSEEENHIQLDLPSIVELRNVINCYWILDEVLPFIIEKVSLVGGTLGIEAGIHEGAQERIAI